MIRKLKRLYNIIYTNIYYPIGTYTPYFDKKGQQIQVGDIVKYKDKSCVVLYDNRVERYSLFPIYSNWFLHGLYNVYSYGEYKILGRCAKRDIEIVIKGRIYGV